MLAVFRLNDATFIRAAWFVKHPTDANIAPLLAAMPGPDKSDLQKLGLPRVEWEHRYGGFLDDGLRGVFAYQEADRFRSFEAQAWAFEQAFVSHQLDPDNEGLRMGAALAAAAVGLFVSSPHGAGRVSLAESLLGVLPVSQDLAQQLAARKLRLL